MTSSIPVTRFDGGQSSRGDDAVAIERPLQIAVNGDNVAITMRTPGHDAELALGFLYNEGLITGLAPYEAEDDSIDFSVSGFATLARRFVSTAACGVCGKESVQDLPPVPMVSSGLSIAAEIVTGLPDKLPAAQTVFEETGGSHAAALFDSAGHLELIREDVGRHNAVDKVVGALLLAGRLPAHDRILVVSGRAGYELVQKAAMAGIPILAAVGAPTTLAIETAKAADITLIAFLRDQRFTVYAGARRVHASLTR